MDGERDDASASTTGTGFDECGGLARLGGQKGDLGKYVRWLVGTSYVDITQL